MIVPSMFGWNSQWYLNSPASVKVWLKLSPGEIAPDWNTPCCSDVAVCGTWSWFVQVTVSPTLISTRSGLNAKLRMSIGTSFPVAGPCAGAAVGASVGAAVGAVVGAAVGADVGATIGAAVACA